MPPKRLFVFCDGTGRDGLILPEGSSPSDHPGTFHDGVNQALRVIACDPGIDTPHAFDQKKPVTNVLRLSHAVKPSDGIRQQLVFYQSGVGSEANLTNVRNFEDSALKALGITAASKIRDAYAFLAQNFEPGDEIFLFGGAYLICKLAYLIDKIGLLETEELGLFFGIWKYLLNGRYPGIPERTRPAKIRCIGLWDTVGATLNSIDIIRITDNVIPPCVEIVLHAVSLQENRQEFHPTLLKKDNRFQVLKEVWFPGSHIDVGGGYDRHELADISLFWIVGEILELLPSAIDIDYIRRCKRPYPSLWGTSQPHNSFEESSSALKLSLHAEDRLASGDITSNIWLHESWKYAPKMGNLQQSYKMVAPDTLDKMFPPVYAPLNTFEKEYRDQWNDTSIALPSAVEDDVSQLFDELEWVSHREITPVEAAHFVKGGEEAYPNATFTVGRAMDRNGGIYPGKYRRWYNDVCYPCDGKENLAKEFDLLLDKSNSLRWIRVSGTLEISSLQGHIPVVGGRERYVGAPFFIAQGYHERGVHCGKVKPGQIAYIPYNWEEVAVETYNILCRKRPRFSFYNTIGACGTYRDSRKVRSGATFSENVTFPRPTSNPPRLVIGLNALDIRSGSKYRVSTSADTITTTGFTAHINTWSNTTLYNATISWLKLSVADPDFQCGTATVEQTTPHRVPFNWKFDVAPTVFVALSGFKFSKDAKIFIYVDDVDWTGFRLHVETKGKTKLQSCDINWVAFPSGKRGVSYGEFGGDSQTSTGYSGRLEFQSPAAFKRSPMVFTTLTKFDMDPRKNLRAQIATSNISETGMDWGVRVWGDTLANGIRGAYLALESDLLE